MFLISTSSSWVCPDCCVVSVLSPMCRSFRKAVTMSATHLAHKCSMWEERRIVEYPSRRYIMLPLCFEELNKYWYFDNSEQWPQLHSQICLRSGDKINFLCGRNRIFKPSSCKSLRVDLWSKRQQQFSIPPSAAEGIHKHSGRCPSSERSSVSAIELLSGKQQPLATLSFVTRLVRVTSIMASLALTAHA